jgi:hypothetical protein
MIISHIQATTATEPKHIPARDFGKPAALVDTLQRLGLLPVPTTLQKLAASGFKVPLADLNHALGQTTLKVHERIAVKIAVDRFGLLR